MRRPEKPVSGSDWGSQRENELNPVVSRCWDFAVLFREVQWAYSGLPQRSTD